MTTVKNTLADEGYAAETVDDQIGDFKVVIDAVVLIPNGFAVTALLAAGFGIVNTLLMSVQERTREIGLMKAMGLSTGLLAGLAGLTLMVFQPITILGIVALVVGIAFLAGSIPAWRAARQDPIESLRYE